MLFFSYLGIMLKFSTGIVGFVLMGASVAIAQAHAERLLLIDSLFCTTDSVPYTGEYTVYYADGSVRANYYFLEGTRHLTSSSFHPNGSLYRIERYSRNKPVGLWQEWNRNGELISTAHFVNGQRTGSWRIKHPETDLTLIMDFRRDDLISAHYE